MTIYTPLGEHHRYVRRIKFSPNVRGTDHAKGESVYVSPLSRRDRIDDRRANTLSKQMCCNRLVQVETASMEVDKISLEEIDLLDQMENECGLCPLYPLDENDILKIAQA